jgi:hypothetical protein
VLDQSTPGFDPTETLIPNFTVVHNTAFYNDVVRCESRAEAAP